VERVQHFKLLGITLSHDMNWQAHIDAIITKASSRLYFLKILKKSGLQSHQLRHFYLSVIRPILEYCSPIWHLISPRPRLSHWKPFNAAHSESLTHLQSAYLTRSHLASPSLHDRREHLNEKNFTSVTIPSSCISRLLPPLRDSSITSRLRTPSIPRPATRTKRYTSFIHHALLNYQ